VNVGLKPGRASSNQEVLAGLIERVTSTMPKTVFAFSASRRAATTNW
jgi:hypothetical protein